MTEEIRKLKEIIDGSDNIVFFGGAGVSTESGIPDFRSVDGLYHQQWSDPPETILSHTYYERYPEKFFAFYRAKLLCPDAKPNAAHRKLAEWERAGKLKAVITQNIDGLHQKAGSREVLELHGSVLLPFLNHIRQNVEMIITYEKRIMMRRGMIETDYCRKPTFATDPVFDSMFDEFYEMTRPYLK